MKFANPVNRSRRTEVNQKESNKTEKFRKPVDIYFVRLYNTH